MTLALRGRLRADLVFGDKGSGHSKELRGSPLASLDLCRTVQLVQSNLAFQLP